MKAVIDIVLIIIIALCTWNGYKRGLVGGVAGILAIIISLLGANILSAAYAHEVVPALEPFVDGYVDSSKNRAVILERMGYGDSDLSLDDILAQDSSLRYDYAYESLSDLGLYEKRAEELAADAVAYAQESGVSMVVARGGREFFVTGHLEYAPNTLDKEYRRDIGKRDDVELPKYYYRDDNPDKGPIVKWRAHANLFFQNWVNYYVYQQTPYDINLIG